MLKKYDAIRLISGDRLLNSQYNEEQGNEN